MKDINRNLKKGLKGHNKVESLLQFVDKLVSCPVIHVSDKGEDDCVALKN